MALQFFRRRQKMVIIIMAILMVSFLIGGYGLSHIVQRGQGGQAWGTTRFGKLTTADLVNADSDLTILGVLNQHVDDLDLGAVAANGDNAPLAYALLRKEAERSPLIVTSDDVDTYLQQRGWTSTRLQSLLEQLRTRMSGLTERHLRQAVMGWVKVQTLFYRSVFAAACPARFGAACSEQQLRHLYRDLAERIDLRVAVFRAEDYLKDVSEPNAEEIQAQFETYRAQQAGVPGKDNPFAFGYVQPNRARLRYLLIRQDVVQRVARPSEEEVRAYYIRNRDRYLKNVPAAEGTTRPTSAPAMEVMSFSEAKPRIVQQLSDAAVNGAMDDLVAQVTLFMDQYATEAHGTIGDAYDYALWRMTVPADAVLARELTNLDLRGEPLESAVSTLADKAGLVAIAFPWGHLGSLTLDPNVKVTLKAEHMTLGEALDSLCAQVKWPPLKWAMLRPLPGELFALAQRDGVDFFPIRIHDTPPMDEQQMRLDEVLGYSQTIAGQPLTHVVFTAEPFLPTGRGTGMKLGDDGTRMVVLGPHPGRLLWRLVGVDPAHTPERLQDVPGLAEQVAEDLRTKVAFQRATEAAQRLEEHARDTGLASAAKRAGIETIQTGLFARKTEVAMRQQYEALARITGRKVSLAALAVQEPFLYPLTQVEGLELPTEQEKQTFMDGAFALAPANVEPPYPTSPPEVGLVSLPALREVLVMQRIGYEPPVGGEYVQVKRLLAAQLENVGLWRSRVTWFSMPNIVRRLQYQPRVKS
jgi:hypothetical protein